MCLNTPIGPKVLITCRVVKWVHLLHWSAMPNIEATAEPSDYSNRQHASHSLTRAKPITELVSRQEAFTLSDGTEHRKALQA